MGLAETLFPLSLRWVVLGMAVLVTFLMLPSLKSLISLISRASSMGFSDRTGFLFSITYLLSRGSYFFLGMSRFSVAVWRFLDSSSSSY